MNLAAAIRTFEGPPPSFLVRGAWMTSSNADCRGCVCAQDSQEASAGHLPASEPETAVLEAPRPAPAASDPEREAALAELTRIMELNAQAAAETERLTAVLVEAAQQVVSQGGLALMSQMRKLMAKHYVDRADPPPLPLLDPIDGDVVRIRAVAATSDLDLDRTCFARDCWPTLSPAGIKLLISHDDNRVAGMVDEISVDIFGRVIIVATITNKAAMRLPGLSISAKVKAFSIRDADDRRAFRGEVTRVSSVNEISLTATPSNRRCGILERWIATPFELSGQAVIDAARSLEAMAHALKANGFFASAA